MKNQILALFISCLLISSHAAKLPKYNIDPKSLTTGGLSSGGFMAV